NPTMDEVLIINGIYCAILGITSTYGRVFGKMCHAERKGQGVALNIYGEQDMILFEAGVAYFK
ncbi:MAG: phosphoribosylformylglycinamidine synthase subunit PurQ, partial [Pseudobutyrivibrio sp.]|nr:phosphoribosylformylglycinamidine synthase subunit PurQ [Pseudobutyrivibrio sp.]